MFERIKGKKCKFEIPQKLFRRSEKMFIVQILSQLKIFLLKVKKSICGD